MKAPHVPGRRVLPKPKYYIAEKTKETRLNRRPRRLTRLGDHNGIARQGGWIRFVPPAQHVTVSLKIPKGGDPYEAVREWFMRREAKRPKRSGRFDLRPLARLWNHGAGPQVQKLSCGSLHMSGTRFGQWVGDALTIWAESGQRSPYPPHVLACLDPEHRAFFVKSPGPSRIPDADRWLDVAFDLAKPLEDQFQRALTHCRLLQDYAFLVAGLPKPRPGRRETLRDVMIYTLRHSLRLTIPQLAESQFPGENSASAQDKVKKILRRVDKAVKPYGPGWSLMRDLQGQ